jgi:hypothetical protein
MLLSTSRPLAVTWTEMCYSVNCNCNLLHFTTVKYFIVGEPEKQYQHFFQEKIEKKNCFTSKGANRVKHFTAVNLRKAAIFWVVLFCVWPSCCCSLVRARPTNQRLMSST